jgi:hypothetical protein
MRPLCTGFREIIPGSLAAGGIGSLMFFRGLKMGKERAPLNRVSGALTMT